MGSNCPPQGEIAFLRNIDFLVMMGKGKLVVAIIKVLSPRRDRQSAIAKVEKREYRDSNDRVDMGCISDQAILWFE